jgi:subtilisin family serine protease
MMTMMGSADGQPPYGSSQKAQKRPQPPATTTETPTYAPDILLVGFKAGATRASRNAAHSALGTQKAHAYRQFPVDVVRIGKTQDLDSVMRAYAARGDVAYVERNYLRKALALPNDPRFDELWGLRNTGQNGGTTGIDIGVEQVWDTTTGDASVVVGVIDTGIDYTHPDLAANMWSNATELAGTLGVDDDGNGIIDDIHGATWLNGDGTPTSGDPFDDIDHGTHCSGTIGAVGNNSVGVAGVNWQVRLMGLKFLGIDGGWDADALAAIDYAITMNASFTSNSWGGGPGSEALSDAIEAAGNAGQLFIAAAGNDYGNDNDANPAYPASFPLDNIISVASITRTGGLSNFSNVGATSVDLGAPGSEILSTVPGGGYAFFDGTSMATPHVAGAAALLLAAKPAATRQELKSWILGGAVSAPSLSGRTLTGGWLHVGDALRIANGGLSPVQSFMALSTGGAVEVTLSWENPASPAFEAVIIRRSTSDYPATPSDGELVYEGADVSFLDGPFPLGERIYYSAWARGTGMEFSSRRTAQVQVGGIINEECANAIPLTTGVPVTGTNVDAGGSMNSICAFDDWRDVWYSWVPGTTGNGSVSLCSAADFDTTLAIYDACDGIEIACNDDYCGLGSEVCFPVNAGSTYLIRVAGYAGDSGNFEIVANPGCVIVPRLYSVSPPVGPVTGGTTVYISGENLDTASEVRFNDNAATGLVVLDSSYLQCTTPPGDIGTANVTVVTNGGDTSTSAPLFTYTLTEDWCPGNLLVNGGFESGDFSGWTAQSSSTDELQPWTVASSGSGYFYNGAPIDGDLFIQNGFDGAAGLTYDLYQDVAIPGGAATVELVWAERIQWEMIYDASMNRTYRVTLEPAGGGAPLAILHELVLEANTTGDTGYVQHRVNLAAAVPGIQGSTVRLRWQQEIPEYYTGPGQFDIDGICLSTLDSPLPMIASINPMGGSAWGGTNVTLTGTNLAEVTSVDFGGAPASDVIALGTTTVTCTTPPGAVGPVSVTALSPLGTSNAVTYTYTAPLAPTLTAINPNFGSTTGGDEVTLTGTSLTGATEVRFGESAAADVVVTSPSRITCTSPPGSAGIANVTVVIPAGTSSPLAFTYAPPGSPVLTGLSPATGGTAGGTTVTLTGGNLIGTWGVSIGGRPATSIAVASATMLRCVTPARATPGPVDVTVTNATGTSNPLTYTYAGTPALTAISPASGPAVGGAAVTLTGANLAAATAVYFGGTAAAGVASLGATTVFCTTPAQSPGEVMVTVRTPGGVSNGIAYTYQFPPILTGVSPGFASTAGGTLITLTGGNLSGATGVNFGGTFGSSVTAVSNSTVTCLAPPRGPGDAQVTVIGPGGTSNALAFTFLPPPALISINPNAGPASGGSTAVLMGTWLTGATSVTFGGVPATSYTVDTPNQITAVIPAGAAGSAPVVVTTPGGSGGGVSFNYIAAPTLASVSPASGTTLGGDTVTLTGTALTGATEVRFGSDAAASFSVTSATQITAVTPAASAGEAAVTVTTPSGTSNSVLFTFETPCAVNLSPSSASGGAQAGTAVFTLTANGPWTAETDEPWATVSPASGTGDGTLRVSFSQNDTGEVRSAVLTVTCDESDSTESATINQGDCLLTPPRNVAASQATTVGSVTVTWDDVAGAAGYRIHRAAGAGAAFSSAAVIGESATTSFIDTAAEPGTITWQGCMGNLVTTAAGEDAPGPSYTVLETVFGAQYTYFVTAIDGDCVSEPGNPAVGFSQKDRQPAAFPPANAGNLLLLLGVTLLVGWLSQTHRRRARGRHIQ